MTNTIIFLVILSVFTIMLIPSSDAMLWDLIIQTNVEYSTSLPGTPIISGIVTDHASKPVNDATISIRTGDGTVITSTDEEGKFSVELTDIKRITGNYIVNIIATTPDGKTGITSTEFQVIGEFTKSSIIEEKLSTPEALKYLSANPTQFNKDPIGFILFNHYQKLLKEYFDIENQKIPEYQRYLEEQQQMINVSEEQTSINSFSGTYEEYLESMETPIRDVVENQINLTIKIFDEAKQIKNNILENNGTEEDANLAYLEYISISKESLENFGAGNEESQIKITSNGEDITIQSDISGVRITVTTNATMISITINGVIAEYMIDENNTLKNNLEN